MKQCTECLKYLPKATGFYKKGDTATQGKCKACFNLVKREKAIAKKSAPAPTAVAGWPWVYNGKVFEGARV